jgi:hypothetical protein
VVHAPREPRPEPHHVRRRRRVRAQDVVHLPPRDGGQRGGWHGAAAAGDGGAGGAEVLGVGEEEEGGRGHVLHVAVAFLEQESPRRELRRLEPGGARHQRAHVAVGVRLVELQPGGRCPVAGGVWLQEPLGEEDLGAHALVVPAEGEVVLLRAQRVPVRVDVRQVRVRRRRVAAAAAALPRRRRQVQPRRRPQELVLRMITL